MQQFNLDIWLQDKSRKVVTRRGNPVRIICTDRKHGEDELPVVFLEECSNGGEFLLSCKSDGTSDEHYATQYDLFFADEEEELTEFDYAVLSIISDHNNHTDSIEAFAKRSSKKLLELARKELNNDNFKIKDTEEYNSLTDFEKAMCDVCSISGGYQHAIISTVKQFSKTLLDLARKEILKDLPKWKKTVQDYYNQRNIPCTNPTISGDEEYLIVGTYEIKISNLETLPKEE